VVATPERPTVQVVEIPLNRIKVTTRLRGTDPQKVTDIAESVEGIGLLHSITVSKHGDCFHLLSGMHRLEAFRQLGRQTIPATIKDADPLIEELIEVEENLVSSRLSAIDEARFIVRWEEILTALGRRAKQGDNRWIRSGLTNEELARNRGMSKRSYQYTKSIANLHPEVQDLLNETEFANSKMDMVALAKETDEVQLEVARLLITGKCQGFKRALQLARCKILVFDWDEEKARLREQIGKPFSVMKWNGDSSPLSRLCKIVSQDDACRISKKTWGTTECPNYSQHPDHSAYFINYYSKEGDTIADVMSGRTCLWVLLWAGRWLVTTSHLTTCRQCVQRAWNTQTLHQRTWCCTTVMEYPSRNTTVRRQSGTWSPLILLMSSMLKPMVMMTGIYVTSRIWMPLMPSWKNAW